jgi:replicative DNA helicase
MEIGEGGSPASTHCEVAVLGCMMLDENAINDAMERLVVEDFSLDSHRRIFRAITALAEIGAHVDLETVINELERKRELDAVGGPAYVAYLSEGVPRNFNIESYVRILKDKSLLRQLMGIFHDGAVRASDQSEDAVTVMNDVEERILELSQEQQQKGFSTVLDAAKEAGGIDAFVDKMCDPVAMTGLAIGFRDVDSMLGGLQRKELILIAARPSVGKTAIGLNIASNVVIDDLELVVALFSLEMSSASLHKRLLASLAGVNMRKAAQGFASRDERTRMASALIKIADRNLLIDDTSTMTVTAMRAKCRRLKQQRGRLDLVIIDYLQILSGSKKYNSREQEVSSIARALKAMAKELDVPVLALAQVGRKAEDRGDRRPTLSTLRESGELEAAADVVLFVHREEMYASADDQNVERGIAEIIASKNRNGPIGTVKLAYQAEYTRFSDLDIQH